MSNFGYFRALETPGGDLGFQGSILGWFWDTLGICFLGAFFEGLWITFLTILGWFWAPFWGPFRYILDTKREPAPNNEKLNLCCDLLYFRHVADPENDAISE